MRENRTSFAHLGAQSAVTALRSPEWAAEYLGMPVAWVLVAAERGDLPSIRFERAIRFDPVVIKAWVRARSKPKQHLSPSKTPVSKELHALRQEIRGIASASDLAISADEAARRLGCGRTRIFELVKQRVLARAKSYGRRTMVIAASVEALLAGNGAKPILRLRKRSPAQIETEIRNLKP